MKKLHTIVLISLITTSCFAGNIAGSFKEAAARADAQDVTDRAIRIYADIDLKDYYQQKYMPVFQSCLKSTEHPDIDVLVRCGDWKKWSRAATLCGPRNQYAWLCSTDSVKGRVSTSPICSLLHAHDDELFQLN
jgi:hypothetical protein